MVDVERHSPSASGVRGQTISASASSAASYAGYAAALYQAYKGDYASGIARLLERRDETMFDPWGATNQCAGRYAG